MVVEGRDRNAGQRPDVVEVDFGGQHVDQRLVRLGRLAPARSVRPRCFSGAPKRGSPVATSRGTPKPYCQRRQRRDAGVERRAARQQLAGCRLLLRPARHARRRCARAPRRTGSAGLFLSMNCSMPVLPPSRVDDGLGEQLGLAPPGRRPGPASSRCGWPAARARARRRGRPIRAGAWMRCRCSSASASSSDSVDGWFHADQAGCADRQRLAERAGGALRPGTRGCAHAQR